LTDRVSNSYKILLLLQRLSIANNLRESAIEAAEEALVSNSVLNLYLDLVVRSAFYTPTLVDRVQLVLKIVAEQTTILECLQCAKLLLVRKRLLLASVQSAQPDLAVLILLRFVRVREDVVYVALRRCWR